ncbi:MAG TPA: GNAT family N-acetyltransferase [Flavobacteriales bacterium]|jgi:RimJ/RimL family protein N-acetyltransferase|nr:GNAT family N-acetyltransferase [Flavobacteriales bacterium]
MIELNKISKSEFKAEILQSKDSIQWFIWYFNNRVGGIQYNSLFRNKIHIGVCFFIEKNHSIEVGIMIKKQFRNSGFGKTIINQFIRDRKKSLIFHVSASNITSQRFFQNFVNVGKLDIRQEEKNMVFTTINRGLL